MERNGELCFLHMKSLSGTQKSLCSSKLVSSNIPACLTKCHPLHSHPPDIFCEISRCQPQHYSLLNEAASTRRQESYSTNANDGSPPFHILHAALSLLTCSIIFHYCILCCFQESSAKMTALAASPFTSSPNDMKYHRVQRFTVSVISQDILKLAS